MPYISKQIRKILDPNIRRLAVAIAGRGDGKLTSEAGILNYTITKLLLELTPLASKYWHHALVAGVLDNVKDEYYRRRTVPYEDGKIATAGDVY